MTMLFGDQDNYQDHDSPNRGWYDHMAAGMTIWLLAMASFVQPYHGDFESSAYTRTMTVSVWQQCTIGGCQHLINWHMPCMLQPIVFGWNHSREPYQNGGSSRFMVILAKTTVAFSAWDKVCCTPSLAVDFVLSKERRTRASFKITHFQYANMYQ